MEIRSTRIDRKREANRTALLRSAAGLFAGAGFEGTSMDDIASAADLTKRTLYQYFPSKEELLFAVAAHLLAGYRLEVAPATDGGSAHQRLSSFVEAFYGVIRDHPGDAAIMGTALSLRDSVRAYKETVRSGSELGALEQALGDLYRTFVGAIVEGILDGSIESSVDPEGAAFAVFFLIKGFIGLIAGGTESMQGTLGRAARDKLALYSLGLVMKGMKAP